MARGMDTGQLILLGAGIWGLYQGSQGKLPDSLQKFYNKYIGAPKGTTGGSTSGGDSGGGNWDSTTLGIQACVGVNWNKTHSKPPQSIAELDAWGDQNGYHHPDGSWTC